MANIFRMGGVIAFQQRACETCVALSDIEASERENDQRLENLRERWKEICPISYRKTDLSRLELPQPIIERVMNWPHEGKGLGLIGRSGRWKTRLMFCALEKHHLAGRNVLYVNATLMSDELASRYADSAKVAEEWMNRLSKVSVLFIDDLGKDRLTDRAEASLYRIMEYRGANEKQTFFTANCTGPDLARRMSEDRGDPIVRRLRDMCEIVTL